MKNKRILLLIQDRDGLRTSTKWSPRRNNFHLNTNNSNNNNNNNNTTTRLATVKSVRRDNGFKPNVNIFLAKTYQSLKIFSFFESLEYSETVPTYTCNIGNKIRLRY